MQEIQTPVKNQQDVDEMPRLQCRTHSKSLD